jgi:starch-binding outer membrane protein, SusD/RagB family
LDADSITNLIEDYIIAERALELAFEGKRWFDLVRVAERRNDPAYLADKVAAKFAGTSQYEAIRNKLMNPRQLVFTF